MRKTKKKIIRWGTTAVIIIAATVAACNMAVKINADGRTTADLSQVPTRDVALVLGTPPKSIRTGGGNPYFTARIDAAARLYKAGKARKLLLSGSDHSAFGLNEVTCMRDSLRQLGVPDSVMILDGKGYRTLASVRRATEVYGFKSYTVVSQKFHNERAIYQADHSGLGVSGITGFNASDVTGLRGTRIAVREWLARVKLMADIYLHSHKTKAGPTQ